MEYTDLAFILAAGTAAILIGLSKGGLSLVGSVSVPLLSLFISPVKAAALLLPLFVVSDIVGVWSYRREFDRTNLLILLPPGIAGVTIGWATASLVSDRMVGLLIGVIGITFCLNSWRLRHRELAPKPADLPRGMFWGTIMGFTSFVLHAGVPPFQVYVLPQRLKKMVYAGTTAITFGIINAVKLVPYWALGQFTTANLRTSLYLMPLAIGGTWAGIRLVRILPERSYFVVMQLLLFLVSIKLVTDAFAK